MPAPITVHTLAQWLAAGKDLILLDVREPFELAHAALPHTHHIPMAQIPMRQNELPDGIPIVVMCHHGVRSFQVGLFLERAGFEDIYNLEGGIDAWSQHIDPAVARY